MSLIALSLLAGVTIAAPAASSSQPPAIPISYSYGGYPRIQADIHWGTPAGQDVSTIFDTGSSSFWVYGPNATINDGSRYHYTQGPCNKSVQAFFDWPKSSTHSKLTTIPNGGYSYAYGGNGKIISAHSLINDSISFGSSAWPAMTNTQVALSNFTVVTQLDSDCAIPESDFDHSILGLAPLSAGNTFPPSFRQNLFNQGKTKSSSFSMWFDKAPADVKGKFQGTSIFGAVPSKSKYTGELVRVPLDPPTDQAYVGYYVALPKLTATNIHKPGKPKNIGVKDKSVTRCLLDSGTGDTRLPFSEDQLNNVTGLVQLQDPYATVYNGTCDSIPASATLNFTFVGATAGKSVTVTVPIRNFARGTDDQYPNFDTSKYCGLSLSLDEYGDCTFGAAFFTSAFAVFSDEKKQVALAQGGVSAGSADGVKGLGTVTTILPGQDIPGSV